MEDDVVKISVAEQEMTFSLERTGLKGQDLDNFRELNDDEKKNFFKFRRQKLEGLFAKAQGLIKILGASVVELSLSTIDAQLFKNAKAFISNDVTGFTYGFSSNTGLGVGRDILKWAGWNDRTVYHPNILNWIESLEFGAGFEVGFSVLWDKNKGRYFEIFLSSHPTSEVHAPAFEVMVNVRGLYVSAAKRGKMGYFAEKSCVTVLPLSLIVRCTEDSVAVGIGKGPVFPVGITTIGAYTQDGYRFGRRFVGLNDLLGGYVEEEKPTTLPDLLELGESKDKKGNEKVTSVLFYSSHHKSAVVQERHLLAAGTQSLSFAECEMTVTGFGRFEGLDVTKNCDPMGALYIPFSSEYDPGAPGNRVIDQFNEDVTRQFAARMEKILGNARAAIPSGVASLIASRMLYRWFMKPPGVVAAPPKTRVGALLRYVGDKFRSLTSRLGQVKVLRFAGKFLKGSVLTAFFVTVVPMGVGSILVGINDLWYNWGSIASVETIGKIHHQYDGPDTSPEIQESMKDIGETVFQQAFEHLRESIRAAALNSNSA